MHEITVPYDSALFRDPKWYVLFVRSNQRRQRRSPYRQVEICYVFDTIEDASNPHRATEAGFTHLASDAKRSGQNCYYLEGRVQQCLPRHYQRCIEYMQSSRVHKSGDDRKSLLPGTIHIDSGESKDEVGGEDAAHDMEPSGIGVDPIQPSLEMQPGNKSRSWR